MNNIKRKEAAENTLKVLKEGFYLNKKDQEVNISDIQSLAEQNTKVFNPEDLDKILNFNTIQASYTTKFEVVNETTLLAGKRMLDEGEKNIMCLNFASAKNAGGGFLNGAQAQEESLARASGLYKCLLKGEIYYTTHRNTNTCLYTDYMIYTPNVPVFKDDEGELLDNFWVVNFITSPAVNAGVIRRQEPHNVDKIIPTMQKRTAKMLALANQYSNEVLVLGAWGCGVFQNNPSDIAQIFKEEFSTRFKNVFKRVVFAIKTKEEQFLKPFEDRFL
jgi:uncharacterized protein (TIGR02452 family)